MVTNYRLGVISIQPHDDLYKKHNIFSINSIFDVCHNMLLNLFMANYSSGIYRINNNQTVEHLFPQPGEVNTTNISL